MPCIHGSSIMMHGQNILHAVHSWLIHHGTWSKHFACPSFMAQEMDVQQHTSMIRNTAAMLSSTAKQIVDRSRDYQWLLDHYSIQPRCPQPHSNALTYTFGTKSRRAHAMDIGTPGSIFTLQKKNFLQPPLFLLPSSLDRKGLVGSVTQWSLFYSHDSRTHIIHRIGRTPPQHSKHQLLRQAFIFYYHQVWIKKHPSRIGHRIIGRDNQISHRIVRAALYFHDTATQ